MVEIRFKAIHGKATLPKQSTPSSAGFDLYTTEAFSLRATECRTIGSGLKIESWKGGGCLLVKERSSLARHHSIMCLGGVIDSDFRGEICVILYNAGSGDVEFGVRERIAQMIPIATCPLRLSFLGDKDDDNGRQEKSVTLRGEGGFGSTGRF